MEGGVSRPDFIREGEGVGLTLQGFGWERVLRMILIILILEKKTAKFPHSPILYYACRSLLTENNVKNNATAVGLCAVFAISW